MRLTPQDQVLIVETILGVLILIAFGSLIAIPLIRFL